MDSGFRDKKGYVAVMSRSDDVINVAGHRLSTGALEEVCVPVVMIYLHIYGMWYWLLGWVGR